MDLKGTGRMLRLLARCSRELLCEFYLADMAVLDTDDRSRSFLNIFFLLYVPHLVHLSPSLVPKYNYYLPSFFFTLFSPITLYQLHNIYGLAAVNVALLLILSFTGHFLRSPSLHHTRSNSCCPICSTPGLLFPSLFRPCCTIKNWLEARSAVS